MKNKEFSKKKITRFSYMFNGRTNISERVRSLFAQISEHIERATLPAPLLS